MTESFTNNIYKDMVQQHNFASQTNNCFMDTHKDDEFDNMLDKIQKKARTLGNLKNKENDKSGDVANFKEILSEATEEANVETSLNLTLARDIGEIISQLKEAVKITEDENTDYTENSENSENIATDELPLSAEAVKIESIEDDKETREDKKESVNIVFEQALAMFDNLRSEKLSANITEQRSFSNFANNTTINDSTKEDTNNLITKEDTDSLKSLAKNNDSNSSEFQLDSEILSELNIESIAGEGDASSSSNNNFFNSQTPGELSLKAILNKSENVNFNLDKALAESKSNATSPEKIIEQFTKQMDSLRNGSKVNIVLNPEALGKVNLQLINTKEGLSAQFTVTTQEARELLMKGVEELKEHLLAQGVSVDNILVKLNETEESQYNPDWTEQENSKNPHQREQDTEQKEKEKGLFEQTIAKSLEDNNGSV